MRASARYALLPAVGVSVTLLACVPGSPYAPEQFAFPKDLVLTLTGSACAAALLFHSTPPRFSAPEALFVVVLLWGAIIGPFTAINPYQVWPILGLLSAGLLIAISARHFVALDGRRIPYGAIGVALTILVTLVLMEAYGVVPFFSEYGRRPGATLGNRNLVARVVCLTLPLMWRSTVASRTTRERLTTGLQLTGVTIVMTLSRSRGVWLVAALLMIAIPAGWWALHRSRRARSGRIVIARWMLPCILGIAVAFVIPNRMQWGRAAFYWTARRVIDVNSGSGRGRILQVQTTRGIIHASPLGVGPGNWSVVYPSYAESGDPSISSFDIYPVQHVARNDALRFVAEFGWAPAAIAMLALVSLVTSALRSIRRTQLRRRDAGLFVVAMVGAAGAIGVVDPVIQLAPTLGLIALLLGTACGHQSAESAGTPRTSLRRWGECGAVLLLGVLSAHASVVAVRHLQVDAVLRKPLTIERATSASTIDPNHFEARIYLALALVNSDRCDLATPHLRWAARLQPFAPVIDQLRSTCRLNLRQQSEVR